MLKTRTVVYVSGPIEAILCLLANDEIHRKKRKKPKKNKKVFPSQLIQLIVKLRRIDLEFTNLEKVDFAWNKLWKKNLNSMINIEISEDNKERSAKKH